jgi:hypothetical protein
LGTIPTPHPTEKKVTIWSAKEKRSENVLLGLRKFATQIRVLIKVPRGRGDGKSFLRTFAMALFVRSPRNVTFSDHHKHSPLFFFIPNNLQKSRLNSLQQSHSLSAVDGKLSGEGSSSLLFFFPPFAFEAEVT